VYCEKCITYTENSSVLSEASFFHCFPFHLYRHCKTLYYFLSLFLLPLFRPLCFISHLLNFLVPSFPLSHFLSIVI
jgi:hypothetical protein